MDTDLARQAAEILYQHRQAGTVLDTLPAAIRPESRAQGYHIQAMLEEDRADKRVGWKIAATSQAGQRHIGLTGPIAGRILSSMVVPHAQTAPFGHNHMRVAEAEFVFCVGRDIGPRTKPYSKDEVRAEISSLHLGLEFPDSRFADFASAGEAQLIADNACAHKFMMSPAIEDSWRDLDLSSHMVQGRVSGLTGQAEAEYEGVGANVLGCPYIAMTWLVNELSAQNITLNEGEFVTTGTTTLPMAIQPGCLVSADFGRLGRIYCQLGRN